MIITRKSLPRRTFLKGLGACVSMPLLDAMIPAMTVASETAASAENLRRLGYVYMPMGCDMSRWAPDPNSKVLGDLPPILQPLKSLRKSINVLSGMELQKAYPGSHATSNSAFLSAARAKVTEGNDYYLGITADQIAAKHLGPVSYTHLTLPTILLV